MKKSTLHQPGTDIIALCFGGLRQLPCRLLILLFLFAGCKPKKLCPAYTFAAPYTPCAGDSCRSYTVVDTTGNEIYEPIKIKQ